MLDAALIHTCAPTVAPETIAAIVQVESGGNPFAVHINGQAQQAPIASRDEAIALATQAIARGKSVDMGLMQVNSQHLQALHISVADLFNPCANLRAGSAILKDDYLRASRWAKDQQLALKLALSAYNTGNFQSGFDNGYVAKYSAFITMPVRPSPSVTASFSVAPPFYADGAPDMSDVSGIDNSNPYTADTRVYQQEPT